MPFRSLSNAVATKLPGTVAPRSSPSLGRVFAWHNWAQPFSVRTTYETEVTFGTYQADEEFVALQVRPSRTLTASYLEGDQLGSHLEQLVMSASPRAGQTFSSAVSYLRSGLGLSWKMPLECDAVEATAATSGGSVAGDFAYRRFFVGAEVFVAPPGRQTISLGGAEYVAVTATVNAVSDTSIDVSAPVTLDRGWKVIPLVDCVPLLEAELSYQTAKVLEVELQGVEYPGASALPPTISARQVPAGVETFTDATGISRMVLPPGQNWEEGMSVGLARAGTEGVLPRLAGAKPYWRLTVEDRVFSRAEWWSLLQMFDAHSGGARSMWVIDPRALTNSAQRGAGNNSIILPELGVLDEFIETTPAIAYQLPDGTWHISELGTPNANDWDIPVVNALGGTGNLGCVHRAFVGRFTGGGFDESWTSWDICNVSYEIVQTDGQSPNELEVPV